MIAAQRNLEEKPNGKRKLNEDYFHSLLFTRENLKLVHIVCHDKQEHLSKKCDPEKFFVDVDDLDNKGDSSPLPVKRKTAQSTVTKATSLAKSRTRTTRSLK